jgi:hypothetical protein
MWSPSCIQEIRLARSRYPDPADGTLLLTGKLWPWLFRAEVVER